MERDPATTLSDIFGFVKDLNAASSSWIFRGQADSSWGLHPKIGRDEFLTNYSWFNYLGHFNEWVRTAENYMNLPENEWAKLALAQHYGLATHYLDWTTNPFIALFFALTDKREKDGMVFAFETSDIEYLPHASIKLSDQIDPMEQLENRSTRTEVWLCRLKPTNGRIVNQNSVLTFHPYPQKDFRDCRISSDGNKAKVLSLEIASKSKPKILEELYQFGVNYKAVFPDIEGLTKQINSDMLDGKMGF